MKDNLPEKGAIVQRDRETYAIAPHLPGGIVDPATLRKIADVAEKYGGCSPQDDFCSKDSNRWSERRGSR